MNSNPNPQEDKSNKQPEPLYELIHSMTANEKRYFNVQVNKQKANDDEVIEYFVLFKILNKMKTYDEKKAKTQLLKTIGKEKYSNFAVKKNELYDVLMRQLKNYAYIKMKESADYIKVLIYDANFLFKRGLYNQAKKHLIEARKMAEECGDTLSLIEINRLEREFWRMSRDIDMEERIIELHKEEEQLMDALGLEEKLIKSYDSLFILRMKHTRLSNKKSIKKLQNQFKNLLEIEDSNLSNISQRFLWSSLTTYFYLLGENEKLHKNVLKVFGWWEENILWRKQTPYYYISALSNLLVMYGRTKEYDKFPKVLEKMRKIVPNNQHESMTRFHRLMFFQQLYYLNKGLVEEVGNLSNAILKGIKKYTLSKSVQTSLIFNIIVAYLIIRNFRKCIEWIEHLNAFKKKGRGEIHIQFVQLLKVIAFYELKELEETRSAYEDAKDYYLTFLNLEENDFNLEVLNQIKQYTIVPESEQRSILRGLKKYIETNQSNSDTYRQIGGEELILWIDNKLTNKPMKDLLIERNGKR